MQELSLTCYFVFTVIKSKISSQLKQEFFLFFFSALLGYFDWKPGQSCLNIKTIERERAVSGAYWLNKTGALFQVNILSVWYVFKKLNLGAIKGTVYLQ